MGEGGGESWACRVRKRVNKPAYAVRKWACTCAEWLSTKALGSLVPRPYQPQCGSLSVSRAGRRVWLHLSCFHVQMERSITRCHVIRISLAINY